MSAYPNFGHLFYPEVTLRDKADGKAFEILMGGNALIEAGTFLCAVAAAGGEVLLKDARAEHLDAVIDKLREAGVSIDSGEGWVRARAVRRPKAVDLRPEFREWKLSARRQGATSRGPM